MKNLAEENATSTPLLEEMERRKGDVGFWT